jgi:hypothetical protein
MSKKFTISIGIVAALACAAKQPTSQARTVPPSVLTQTQQKILASEKDQVRQAASYVPDYVRIPYPNGDVPQTIGACTDVVIRALRAAGFDLQRLIHDDMKRHFSEYPRREVHPDSNIDHRRVPNQIYFFRKYGRELTLLTDDKHARDWQPGDIVYWKLGNGLDHAGMISNRMDARGLPFVVHNLMICREEDVLTDWKIVAHFRFPR